MSTNLPKTIETYFRALNIYDSELLAECFTEDATFKDEGKEYQGLDAIKAHIIEINNNPKVKTVVTNSIDSNGETIVTAGVSRNLCKRAIGAKQGKIFCGAEDRSPAFR